MLVDWTKTLLRFSVFHFFCSSAVSNCFLLEVSYFSTFFANFSAVSPGKMDKIVEIYGQIARSFASSSNEEHRKTYARGLHFWLISKFDHAEFHHFIQDRGATDPSVLSFHQDLCLELYKLDKNEAPERRLLLKRILQAILKANRRSDLENPSDNVQLTHIQPEATSLMSIAVENILKNALDTVLLQRMSAGCEDGKLTSKMVSLSELKP